jgi:hypothetical protein
VANSDDEGKQSTATRSKQSRASAELMEIGDSSSSALRQPEEPLDMEPLHFAVSSSSSCDQEVALKHVMGPPDQHQFVSLCDMPASMNPPV